MKICGYLGLLFGALFISLFGLSLDANAESPYDDIILTTDNLQLQGYSQGEKLYNVPRLQWSELFSSPELPSYLAEDFGNYYQYDSGCDFNPSTAKQWVVLQMVDTRSNRNYKGIIITYTNDENATLSFFPDSVNVTNYSDYNNWKSCIVRISEPNRIERVQADGFQTFYWVDYDMEKFMVFLMNANLIYPGGYEGQKPKDTIKEPTKIYPNYQYTVTAQGKLTVKTLNWLGYRDSHGGGLRIGDISGETTVRYCGIPSKTDLRCDSEYDDPSYNIIGNPFIPAQANVDVQLEEHGYYKVYFDNSNAYPRIPPFSEEDGPYIVSDREIVVYWDGTSIVTGSTVGQDGKQVVTADGSPEQTFYDKFTENTPINDHGLLAVILLPLSYLNKLPQQTCSPITIPMPAKFGEDIVFQCLQENVYKRHFNEMFTIYQLLISAIFVYGISLRMFENIKKLSNPKDDSIEVVKL